jgi:putative membrane protein
MTLAVLPTLNAILNGTSAMLLLLGYLFIRQKNIPAHKTSMLLAFGSSMLFLSSYIVYHSRVGAVRFQGQGLIQILYLVILMSHTTLAAAIVPMALFTLYRAWRGRFEPHRRIARYTLPIWLYVSLTGVLIYWILYH